MQISSICSLRRQRAAEGYIARDTHAAQGYEALCVPFLDALLVGAGVSAVAVHHEGDMAGYRAGGEDGEEDIAGVGGGCAGEPLG